MIGRAAAWTALLLLLVCTGTSMAEDLTITTMNWNYADSTTTLVICTTEVLGILPTLTMTTADVPNGPVTGQVEDNTCAHFTFDEKMPLPSVKTEYLLSAGPIQSRLNGFVSFSLEGTKITCTAAQFLRFILNPEVDGVDSCISSHGMDTSVCYVTDDSTPDPVCFTGLDQGHTDFKVCVQKTAFEDTTNIAGFLTADVFNYSDWSFTLSYDVTSATLVELLMSPDAGGSWNVGSCASNTCAYDPLPPSTALYSLCGVFTDTVVTVSSSSDASFQDMKLMVNTIGSTTVDFYFINLYSEKMYNIYSFSDSGDTINTGTLDCSHIEENEICNGFFDFRAEMSHVGVSYQNEDNKIIAPLDGQ